MAAAVSSPLRHALAAALVLAAAGCTSGPQLAAQWTDPQLGPKSGYLRGGRVRGVLLWNVWEQVDAARRLIAERGPSQAKDLKGRLPA